MKKVRDYLQSNKIKFYLKEINMTQEELAATIGCDKSYISRIINAKHKCISLSMGIKISEVLGRSVEEVFNFKEE